VAALTLDATPAALTANTYALLADAEAYYLTLPVGNDWASATDAQKNAALAQATRMLDSSIQDWKGLRKTYAQPLQWPRAWMSDREGWVVDSNSIPPKIRDACCEFAIRLISDDRAADAGGLSPETVKVGSLDVGQLRHRPIPASVLAMVREYREGGGSGPGIVLA
jgi:hypothetical protein